MLPVYILIILKKKEVYNVFCAVVGRRREIVLGFNIIKILLDPSFLGALIGAVITGMIAIVVFILSNWNENKKRKSAITNYYKLIKDVHNKTCPIFVLFLDVGNEKVHLPEDYRTKLVELSSQQGILNLINIDELIKESNEAYDILNYIVKFRASFTIIDSSFGTMYGDRRKIDQIINNSNLNKLESNIKQLKKIISNIQ